MTWDWTQVSRAIGEHSNHHANVRYRYKNNVEIFTFICAGCEDDEPHWTVKYRARLILCECYSPDLPLWLGSYSRNPRFLAYLILPDHRSSCSPSEISWTICTVTNFALTLRTINVSGCFWGVMTLFNDISFQIRLRCTFIWVAFKSHTGEVMHNVSAHRVTTH